VNGETKFGLVAVGLMAVCCGGPLLLSLVASGAVLGALGALRSSGPMLLAAAALLGAVGVLLWRRARASGQGTGCPTARRSADSPVELSALRPRRGGR